MREIYNGADREKTRFTITTSTLDKEDRLHLIIINHKRTVEYVFCCNDTYNHNTQWNVTRCKAVLKAIENGKIEVKKRKMKNVARSKRPVCIYALHHKDGKEYAWNVPKKYTDKVQEGMWIKVDTRKGKKLAKITRVVLKSEMEYEPIQEVIYIPHKQDHELMTAEEYMNYVAELKASQQIKKQTSKAEQSIKYDG